MRSGERDVAAGMFVYSFPVAEYVIAAAFYADGIIEASTMLPYAERLVRGIRVENE